MDKWIYKFLDWLDSWSSWIDDLFIQEPKPKKKHKNKCKLCHCDCHCSDVFHNHFYDGDVCTCDTCRH